ncbi:division/cell wall cluster transcriptional repressor MraZ [Cereibacter sphaeroides]|nr:division/cell wall cluster transcriptional repressor MraZ [Cereibacter sphaeroides]
MRRITVARGFRGSETQTIDAKGRVSIPASFRRVIEAGDPTWQSGERANMVIVYGGRTQDHLKCYTLEGIEGIEKRIKSLKLGSPERKALERIYHGQSCEVQVFEDGRIQLPQKLREKLELSKQAFFTAASDKFLIYNPDVFSEQEDDIDSWIEEQGEEFDPETLLPELEDIE